MTVRQQHDRHADVAPEPNIAEKDADGELVQGISNMAAGLGRRLCEPATEMACLKGMTGSSTPPHLPPPPPPPPPWDTLLQEWEINRHNQDEPISSRPIV